MGGQAYPFCLGGRRAGVMTLLPQRDRVALSVSCRDDGGGIYRGRLVGDAGTLALGPLVPEGDLLALRCVLPAARVAAVGAVEKGEAVLAFPAGAQNRPAPPGWALEPRPARLFRDPVLQKAAGNVSGAWVRREGETLFLALPWQGEMPLVPLFCFARAVYWAGRRYALFALDAETGLPALAAGRAAGSPRQGGTAQGGPR